MAVPVAAAQAYIHIAASCDVILLVGLQSASCHLQRTASDAQSLKIMDETVHGIKLPLPLARSSSHLVLPFLVPQEMVAVATSALEMALQHPPR